MFQKILMVDDYRGNPVEIRVPPVLIAEEIRARFVDLVEMTQEPGLAEMQFQDAYAQVKKYRRLVNKILSLAGLEPENIGYDVMLKLLFPHYEDGTEILNTQGALIEFLFGPLDNDPTNSTVDMEQTRGVANLIGELWASTEDFNEVISLLSTVGYEDLVDIMGARNQALKPAGQKAKEKQVVASQKLMERIKQGKVKMADTKGEKISDDALDKSTTRSGRASSRPN